MFEDVVRSVERVRETQSNRFNAPLFRSLIEELKTRDRSVVLDLGAARAQTVALFGRYRCRLEIADVAQELDALNASSDPENLKEVAETLLPRQRCETTDVVFCWDLLNYLERPALRALMSRVEVRARRGTLVHALIAYSHPHMPERPGTYVPQDDGSLVELSAQPATRQAPRYSPEDLRECLPGYMIDRAMLLSNGMQEFLFRY